MADFPIPNEDQQHPGVPAAPIFDNQIMQGPQGGLDAAPPPSAQYSKGLLSNFLGSMLYQGGQAMMKHVGLATDDELQQRDIQNQMQLAHTQAAIGLAHAQTQANQLQDYSLEDGSTIQTTPKGIATIEASKIRGLIQQQIAERKNQITQALENQKEHSPLVEAQIGKINDQREFGQEKIDLAKQAVKAKIQGQNAGMDLKRQQMAAKVTQANKPTSSMQTMGQTAATLIPHVQEMRDLIEQADKKGLIGPAAGRTMSDFLAGKLGSTGDPETDHLLGRLRSTDSLMKSGMLRTHFGAKGGQQMYGVFSNMLNTGKQSKPMLNGVLDTFESFAKGYAQAGGAGAPSGAANAGNGASGMIRARDPQGKLHQAPAGTALPQGWHLEQ